MLLKRLLISTIVQLVLTIALIMSSLSQEWEVRRPKGTLKVVDLGISEISALLNYAEALVPY
jgi:hypothetical protein